MTDRMSDGEFDVCWGFLKGDWGASELEVDHKRSRKAETDARAENVTALIEILELKSENAELKRQRNILNNKNTELQEFKDEIVELVAGQILKDGPPIKEEAK